jgi:hypothetical protein
VPRLDIYHWRGRSAEDHDKGEGVTNCADQRGTYVYKDKEGRMFGRGDTWAVNFTYRTGQRSIEGSSAFHGVREKCIQ